MNTAVQRHDLGLTWFETGRLRRAAHALRDGDSVWLIDPFDDPVALAAAAELGHPAAVIQLLDRHDRDGSAIAQRLEIPRLRLPAAVSDSPFEVVPVIARPWWREIALWWERPGALIVAEAVGTAPYFGLGRPLGMHPMLRLRPPVAALSRPAVRHLLVGHGPPLEAPAAPALHEALSAARRDLPRLVLRLPSLIRDS